MIWIDALAIAICAYTIWLILDRPKENKAEELYRTLLTEHLHRRCRNHGDEG